MTKSDKLFDVSRRSALKLAGTYGVTLASASMGFLGLGAGASFASAAKTEAEKKAAAKHIATMALDGTLDLKPGRPIVADSFWLHGTRTFKRHVETASKGEIYVDLHDAGTLGSQTAALKKVQQGIVQGASCSTQNAAQLAPVWNVLDVPYALNGTDSQWKLLYSKEFNEQLRKPSAAARMTLLYTMPYMREVMVARKIERPMIRPEDMSGLKIRVTGSKMEQLAMDILPCSPTPIAWAELFSALKDGAVDSIHHTPTSSLDGALAPSLGQIVDTNWMPHWDAVWISSVWLSKLPEPLQAVVMEAAYLSQKEIHETFAPLNKDVLGIVPDSPNVGWKAEGVKIIRLTDSQRGAWQDMLSVENNPKVFNPWIDRFGRQAYESVLATVKSGSAEPRHWWV